MKRSLGFTLIELLLSVSIIAILSGAIITVINPAALSARARDSQRLSDLRKVQGALEMYFADHRSYPQDSTGSTGWILLEDVAGMEQYLNPLPSGVRDGEHYSYRSDGTYYNLVAEMETEGSANGNCLGYTEFDSSRCYGVTNP